MHRFACRVIIFGFGLVAAASAPLTSAAAGDASYSSLRQEFAAPDHARWGEVPLWWWEGDRLSKERVIWQLDTLAAKGVKAVCPIQRSPARCYPASFTPEWWDMFQFVHRECQRRGMRLWLYDQIGYGHYGWLEKAAAKTQDPATARIDFQTVDIGPHEVAELSIPAGKLLGARAYPLRDGLADDAESRDIASAISAGTLKWTALDGPWRIAVCVAIPEVRFRMSTKATSTFLDMLYGEIERRCGSAAMGDSFAGIFQDEHPPTPRDAYTERLASTFREQHGYDMARAVSALHFDVGPKTPKYRTDFFDTYLAEDERCYWKPVFDWTTSRGLLTSHDNWGRNSLPSQSQGYIDYFRTQRWFSAPGNDDYGQRPVTQRNYYDTKIAASIARLYHRPRVWCEAFHSSGWGRTTDQTLSWLSANFAFGTNLYDEHGLYYSTRAATWEHAAPDPHWRQPYWRYYGALSDWVARMSFIMSQGTHVVDVAVHYPVVSFLAGQRPKTPSPDYNYYMNVSRAIYDAALDNDLIDDDSILRARVDSGKLHVAGNDYRALVFGPEVTVRRSVLQQALRFARSGGCVLFHGALPTDSPESGRNDPDVGALLEQLIGSLPSGNAVPTSNSPISKRFANGGFCAWVPDLKQLPPTISQQIRRDFLPASKTPVFMSHRKTGTTDVYLVQNVSEKPLQLSARFRVDGVPELWDPFTGAVQPVDAFRRTDGMTHVTQQLEGNIAYLIVFRPGAAWTGDTTTRLPQPDRLSRPLPTEWEFSVIPTRDNRWGEFRWPPSAELIGPEVRQFRYRVERHGTADVPDWWQPNTDDQSWALARYSTGPYWLSLDGLPQQADIGPMLHDDHDTYQPGTAVRIGGRQLTWQPVEFSKTIGLGKPAPWGGHSGYPDGAVDQNFLDLPPGRKLLFTRIRSPRDQQLGLRIALRNSTASLWVNGVRQPIEDAVGNLPLHTGVNEVLIDLPDGGHGMLYVQAQAPAARTMDHVKQAVTPPFQQSQWIHVADSGSGYVRKTFTLKDRPTHSKIVVTAYTGYRLFINGQQVEEDIGPWAKWTHPETVDVTKYLRSGKNVIAAWIQVHSGQNVHGNPSDQAFALALHATLPAGTSFDLVTDDTWKRSVREIDGWETTAFDDSAWTRAKVFGPMGMEPWGRAPLDNLGAASEPRRKLAVELPSPYLTCFDEVADIVYDIKPPNSHWFGWYRFQAPPGLRSLELHTMANAQVWIDGAPAKVSNGVAHVRNVPKHESQVTIRLQMQEGAYGGAAFPDPITLRLGGGVIQPGLWTDHALPTYSGIGVYRQILNLSAVEAARATVLDLGNVLVAAEVIINGKQAGVRLACPFTFDISRLIRPGKNTLEVRVANTLAPHYTLTNESHDLGPTDSGLLGPVMLHQRLPRGQWIRWARGEIGHIESVLATPTKALVQAQRQWEQLAGWKPVTLKAPSTRNRDAFHVLPDGAVRFNTKVPSVAPIQMRFDAKLAGVTGVRLETWPGKTNESGERHAPTSTDPARDIRLSAALPNGRSLVGCTVRIEIADRTEYLHMAEVQVFHARKNLALKGTATQSSTSLGASAQRAIDGNTDGSWAGESVTHTNRQPHPWWEVDLGTDQPIDRIIIWNRTDGGLQTRLRDFRVSVRNRTGDVVWQQFVTTSPDPNLELFLSPAVVRLRPVDHLPRPNQSTTTTNRISTIYATDHPVGFTGGTSYVLTLPPGRVPGGVQLRVSLTRATPPLCDIPADIERILDTLPQSRNADDRETLAKFYRWIAPDLAPLRSRLKRLRAEVRGER